METQGEIAREVAIVTALNAGDRPPLLRAEGIAGVVARSFARGHLDLIVACARRFADWDSPLLGPWLEWIRRPDTSSYLRQNVALLTVNRTNVGPWLDPSETAAAELERHQGKRRWTEWDEEMRRAKTTLAWHPRLAIAEASALRERDGGRERSRALGLLVAASRHWPRHFTLAQMLGDEIVWSLLREAIGADEAKEFWSLISPLLEIDPDDLSLLGTAFMIRCLDEPVGVSIDEIMPEYDLRKRTLQEEIFRTPRPPG